MQFQYVNDSVYVSGVYRNLEGGGDTWGSWGLPPRGQGVAPQWGSRAKPPEAERFPLKLLVKLCNIL